MRARLLLVVASLGYGCASHVPWEAVAKSSSGRAESLLLELVIRDSWEGESRFLVTYEAMAPEGKLQVSGNRSARRSLGVSEVQQLLVLVEDRLMLATSMEVVCEDCKEYSLLVRLGARAHFVILGDIDGAPPSLVTDILTTLHVRPAA